MKTSAKQFTWRVVCAFTVWMLVDTIVSLSGSMAWDDLLTSSERMGRTIYHQGRMDVGDEIGVSLAGSEGRLSATLFRCVQCHGVWGQGMEEGGLRVPPLTPSFLRRPHASLQTGQPREGHTDQTLIRAIIQGVDASGMPLHSGMPRYHFTELQARAVVAYLERIGTEADSDPGVSTKSILVGAALPLSGPLSEIGQDARSVLEGIFRGFNERGGLYGRQIRLIVADAGSDSAQLEAATARLIERDQVFALVGSFEFKEAVGAVSLIERTQVPLLGPLALSPQLADPPNPYIFYTLPGFDVQYRALLDFAVQQARSTKSQSRPRIAIIRPKNTSFIETVLTPSRRATIDMVFDQEYVRGALDQVILGDRLNKRPVDAVIFVGDGEDFLAVCHELERRHLSPILLAAAGMVGHHAFTIPLSLQSNAYLAAAIQPPTEQDRKQLQTLAGHHQLRNLGYARMAQAAATMLGDALMRVGRRINRSLLVEALEGYREVDMGAGVALSYGAQSRIGSSRIHIFRIVSQPPYFIPITDQIVSRVAQ